MYIAKLIPHLNYSVPAQPEHEASYDQESSLEDHNLESWQLLRSSGL